MAEKPAVFVTRRLPDAVEARLNRDYTARINKNDRSYSQSEIIEGAEGCAVLLCAPGDQIDATLIRDLSQSVRVITTFSVGFDHVDIEAAKEAGLVVTNTPDVLTDATADTALLLILGAARRAYEGQKILREGRWIGWRPTQLMGVQVSGKRLGIFGLGRIGQAVAKRARGFDMEIHYSDFRRLPEEQEASAVFHSDPEDLLKVSDFFSVNCPLTADTHHFLNADRIELLPENAIVVNSARGPVIDDEALIAALKSGRIAAAGLDVFEGEPKLNPGYLALENAFLLPHLGSATLETRNAMGFKCLDNMDAYFAGTPLPSQLV